MSKVFEETITLRWRDMDAYGHVNNAVYQTFLEESRWQLAYRLKLLEDIKVNFFIAETKVTYKRPIAYPGAVVIKISLSRVGKTSVTFYQEIYSKDDQDTICSIGETHVVFMDPKTQRPMKIPQVFLDKML